MHRDGDGDRDMKMDGDTMPLLKKHAQEWEVAQSLQLGAGCSPAQNFDLILAAKSQLRLLAAVDSSYPHRDLYSGPHVQRAIRRCY